MSTSASASTKAQSTDQVERVAAYLTELSLREPEEAVENVDEQVADAENLEDAGNAGLAVNAEGAFETEGDPLEGASNTEDAVARDEEASEHQVDAGAHG